tara:strand:- start:3780 stop:4652 length:873 start_codon:yes stop_codon:yes gene_type:complete
MENNKIAVFGDSILDSYTYYFSNRLSPEAPVPVIESIKRDYFPGGAALTSSKLFFLKNNIDLYTQIGEDEYGKILRENLKKVNIFNFGSKNYPTILKNRIIVNNKYYLREDKELFLEHNANKKIIKKFKENIDNYKAVVFVDYKKGYFNKELFSELKVLCMEKDLKIFLDPHVDNIFDFDGINFIKPNLLESKKITEKSNVRSALRELESKYNTVPIVTLGKDGAVTIFDNKIVYSKIYKTKFVDSSGCGDIFFAAFINSIIKNKNLIVSLNTGVKQASASCKVFGYKIN